MMLKQTKTITVLTVLLLGVLATMSGAEDFPEISADHLVKQVYIDAEILEIKHDSSLDLGIQWHYDSKKGDLNRIDALLPALDNSLSGALVSGRALDISYGTLVGTIEAMVQTGKAKVLSRPSIVTLDRHEAVINGGYEIPYFTKRVINGVMVEGTEFHTTGITLKVKPTILEDDMLQLEINPIVSQVIGYRQDRGSYLPIFSERSVKTTVIVRSGESFVLGGLLQNETVKTSDKVPLAGDLPVVGNLFRNRKDSERVTELVIIIHSIIMEPVLD